MEMVGRGKDIKGAVWVAVRVPDGYVAAHSNQARITKFLNNKFNCKTEIDDDAESDCFYVKDVVQFAKDHKLVDDSVKDEDFRKEQDYLSWKGMDKGRLAFRIRTKMVKNVKKNFRNMYRDTMCENCDLREEETQEHLLVCPAWVPERGALDVTEMRDKVEFITRVMKRKSTSCPPWTLGCQKNIDP